MSEIGRRPFTAEAILQGDLPAPLDPNASPAKEMIAFIQDYYVVWSAKDARRLAHEIYQLKPGAPLTTEAAWKAQCDQLVAEGWAYSIVEDLTIHHYDDDILLARGLFTRFGADDKPLLPTRRVTAYAVKPVGDGFRIVDLPLAKW